MFAAPFARKKIRAIAITLVMILCLPLFTAALAASVPSAPRNLTAVAECLGVSNMPLSLYPAYLQTPLGMPVLLEAETNAAGQRLTWSSSVPSVATVDTEGCVTAVSTGETIITCALADQPGVTATCGVLVAAEGSILLWEYAPESVDMDALIAALEAEEAANPPEAPNGL